MESEIIAKVLEYGVLGVVVAGLAIYVWIIQKSHKAERAEWRTESQDQFKTLVTVVSENNSVVSGLKSTLESIERNTRKIIN
jgi:hypothetical protein